MSAAFEITSVDVVRPLTGDTIVMGKTEFSGAPGTTGTSGLHIQYDANATSTTTGALQCAGGIGIAKTLWVGGRLVGCSLADSADPAGAALVVGGNASVGGYATVSGRLSSGSTVASTTPTTGAITVGSGGLNAMGGAIVGGSLASTSTDAVSSLVVGGDATLDSALTVGGDLSVTDTLTYRNVTVTNDATATEATASADPTTGAIVVGAGGATVDGAVSAQGKVTVAGLTTASGAGGVAVTGSLTISGGKLTAAGGLSAGSSLSVGDEGAIVTGAVACNGTSSDSLVVSGDAGINGQLTVGSTVSLSDASDVACEEQLTLLAARSLMYGWFQYILAPGDNLISVAPMPGGIRPGSPISIVCSHYGMPFEGTEPYDATLTIWAYWFIAGQPAPTGPSKPVFQTTVYVEPGKMGHAVLYDDVAPATNTDGATLIIRFANFSVAGARTIYPNGLSLRYIQQTWGSTTYAMST